MVNMLNDGNQIHEEGDYVVIPSVAVFDEFDGRGDEKLKLNFTPEVLQKIADRSNRRMLDTGDACVIYDRHTSENPDDPLPNLLGLATDFRLGTIGKLFPRKCIMATFKFLKDKWEMAKQRPRRSVEIWMDDLCIDVVSLLGDERPARDLGLLFSKKSGRKAKYSYELKGADMELDEVIKKCLDAWMATPEMAWVKDNMSKLKEEMEDDKDKVAEDEKMKKSKDEKIEQVPGGSVDLEDDEWEKGEDNDMKSEKYKLQRDQERRKFAKVQTEKTALESRLLNLERKSRTSERKADLMQLEAEGVVFDMAEELEIVADMDVARYSKHVGHMKKRYSRAPIGVSIKAAVPSNGVARKEPDSEAVHKAAYLVKDGKAKNIEEALTGLGF